MRVTRRTGGPVASAYGSSGTGPLVVSFHGIGGNCHNWQEQVAYCTARFCAVAWDTWAMGLVMIRRTHARHGSMLPME